MRQVIQNTLYLLTQGLYVHRDHLALRIEQDGQLKLSLPIHNLESVLIFGPSAMSPPAMQLCWENNVAVAFLSEQGQFLARVEGVPQGSVLLRRAQHRTADDPILTLRLIRNIVAGKIQNERWLINRTARETTDEAERTKLTTTAQQLAYGLRELPTAPDADTARGIEGHAAALYFEAFPLHLKPAIRERFPFDGRARRPPRDALNCLLSFLYALLRHDWVAALTAVGLDPFVGFLHTDRPGRESLALDLMEEFRALGRPVGDHPAEPRRAQAGPLCGARGRRMGADRGRTQGDHRRLAAAKTRRDDACTIQSQGAPRAAAIPAGADPCARTARRYPELSAAPVHLMAGLFNLKSALPHLKSQI